MIMESIKMLIENQLIFKRIKNLALLERVITLFEINQN